MIKTAIYIRVSTDRQKEGDSVPALQADQDAEPKDRSALEALLSLDIEQIYKTLTPQEKRRFWRGFMDYITFYGWHDVKVYFL